MAEKKKQPVERKIVSASEGTEKKASSPKKTAAEKTDRPTIQPAAPVKGNATGLRIGAFVCWLLGIGFEVFAILVLNGTFNFANPATGADHTLTAIIVALVADLILVIVGSQLWKKSNDIDPASEKNKVKFFLWNNMGLIASLVAFAPILLLLLTNKDLDQKTKRIASVVAVVMLVIAGAASIDYNPTSAEQKAAAEETAITMGVENVYWTPFGRKYHMDPDCQSLQNSATIYEGNIEQAFEANRNTPCKFCATDFEAAMENVVDTGAVEAEPDASLEAAAA
ncbi:hypothetical protein LJC61_06760 [Ruminococcaceae bacterium OttesenSCG-928-A16]|nr:hypothetical protein [Ruminococcaceae bacterium OttesenSCG-928-A16]